jgi:DNA polymerase-3 subunit gamma/tau
VGHKKITAADVNQLLGIAPAERLGGLVRFLVDRDASAALNELDATIKTGVEVGLLLDQLVGYFRDVMAIAAGCRPEQMLYALPSQAAEVAQIGRQLGLATVLAISQILDQTSARMRVSVYGRTLVEMAVVRICQLGELDDLAALVAELRGEDATEPANRTSGSAAQRQTASPTSGAPTAPAKKNVEPAPTRTLANGVASASASAAATSTPSIIAAPPLAVPPQLPASAHESSNSGSAESRPERVPIQASAPNGAQSSLASASSAPSVNELLAETAESEGDSPPSESFSAGFKRTIAQGGVVRPEPGPPRPSRREQLAQIAEQPFVRRAMELFDVQPGQFRYAPPEGE